MIRRWNVGGAVGVLLGYGGIRLASGAGEVIALVVAGVLIVIAIVCNKKVQRLVAVAIKWGSQHDESEVVRPQDRERVKIGDQREPKPPADEGEPESDQELLRIAAFNRRPVADGQLRDRAEARAREPRRATAQTLSPKQRGWFEHQIEVADDLIFAAQKMRSDVVNALTAPGTVMQFAIRPSAISLRTRIVGWRVSLRERLLNLGLVDVAAEFAHDPPALHSELTMADCNRMWDFVQDRKQALSRLLESEGLGQGVS
jgi:hypothetical protein